MAGRDAFTRRTAMPTTLLPWAIELVRTVPGLVRSYVPGSPIPPRARERVILAVSEVNGCRYSALIHGSWQDFLGDVEPDDAEQALLAYARSCAAAGTPLPTDELEAVLPAEAITVLRATVAQVEVANLVGNAADSAMARLMHRRPLAPVALARELATVGAALPVAVPLFSLAAAMRLIDRLAPPRPALELPAADDANLLAHLLSRALPTYCANALVRLATLGLPAPLVVGICSGRSAATVRISRRAVVVENDIAADADLVVDGDVEPLLRFATLSLTHELTAIRLPDAP